jgi:hypothetical protein
MNWEKVWDLHVHVGPEPIPRRFTANGLASLEEGKLAGAVMKSQFFPTSPWARSSGFRLVGSITLNNSVGGLNPEAVRAAAFKKPIIVWFPTISAQNFLDKSDWEIPPEWGRKLSRRSSDVKGIRIEESGRLTEEAEAVLEAIKETGSVLATGHVSWKEAELLVEEAAKMGIRKIIVTHPIYQLIGMPVEVQKRLAGLGAMIEQTYAMYSIDRIPIRSICEQIREIGPENCIMTSDVGQVFSPSPSEALKEFAGLMKENGINENELERMLIINPREIIKECI